MKIAILGGGTAGFIAAAHMTKKHPEATLFHIYDSRIPSIGVGEGTTPSFPPWLKEITGLEFEDLQESCAATLKNGTRFEGWGAQGASYQNRFQPNYLIGYHFDASRIVQVMAQHVRATQIDDKVTDLESKPGGACIRFETAEDLHCDYVLDARGFPPLQDAHDPNSEEFIRLSWIPTGRAILRRQPRNHGLATTRAIARPHGWIFRIPLQETTSNGYLFNPDINSDAEIEADFDAFLHAQGQTEWQARGALNFPNYMRRDFFDGRVFRVGNAASFVEPLEATAIGVSIYQVRMAEQWISDNADKPCAQTAAVAAWNKAMHDFVIRNSLFVAWHYACGSKWDTGFWRHAQTCLERAEKDAHAQPHLGKMKEFIDAGRDLPAQTLAEDRNDEQWAKEILPLLRKFVPFGNFSELNFAQVGHGIGYYNERPDAPEAAIGE